MNLSLKWLADYVDIGDIKAKEYCDRMTDTGSKVEGFKILGDDIKNVVIGKITKITKHENSDHLLICMLDVGKEADVQIVTGAQNVFEGAIVPVALAVAHLPLGIVIKAGKLRGVESNGMLCSIGELGLTEHDMPGADNSGILILGEEYNDKIGVDVCEALLLSDTVVEFEITSNRPDCLSVIGLARESAVSFDKKLKLHTPLVNGTDDGDNIKNHLSVKIEAPDLCYRYCAKIVKNVKIESSPLWMRQRLRASGIRPINNIVDITNYVMLEYGQPMHAFDYSCLDGSQIIVRRSLDGENFKSLDDADHVLDGSTLVIADKTRAVALAGVMGGANSEILDTTKTVVFESATFNGISVRLSAKAQGMRTESSSRFEKGLDSENALVALNRACELIEILGAGDVVDGTIDEYPTKFTPVSLPLEVDKINAFLGVNLGERYMKEVLAKLEFSINCSLVTAPSFRADITCMNDVAEEIIRIYGYNKIQSTAIKAEMTQGGRTPKQDFEVSTEKMLCSVGLCEIQTFSFISPKYYDKIRLPQDSKLRNSITILNPLGEDTSVMRTTAVPSMLETLSRNYNMRNENVRLFENASVYIPKNTAENELPDENRALTLGLYGDCDFYTLKSICEDVFELAGIEKAQYVAVSENPTFHPGRCADILTVNGVFLGTLGQIHPITAQNYSFDMPVYVASLDFDAIFENSKTKKHYKSLPKFPATARDFSFVCNEELEIGKIEKIISDNGGKNLEQIKLFDIYRGPQVGINQKSVSMRITLRATDQTMTVEMADSITGKILTALKDELDIKLRG